jgi:hypothetical protein
MSISCAKIRFLFLVAFCCILANPRLCSADFDISLEDRIPNDGPKCVFASLETLGNHHHIRAIKGLRDNHNWKEADLLSVSDILTSLKIKHQIGFDFGKKLLDFGCMPSARLVELACEKKMGCVCGFWFGTAYHAVTVTELTDSVLTYYDPNNLSRWQGSRQWFNEHWSGYVIVLLPDACI